MKKLLFIMMLTLLDIECLHYPLQSCPTCVGNALESRMPFFTDECYQELDLKDNDFKQTGTNLLFEQGE
ncbi:MAG: hypothetical protein AB7R69_01560 [Candidatus Babeliales bacterium]